MANIQLYCYDFFDIPYIIIICTMMILLNIMILLWLMGDPFCDLRLIHISVRLVLSEIMFTMHRRHVLNIVSIMKKSICTIFGSCKDSMWTTIMSNLCVYHFDSCIQPAFCLICIFDVSMWSAAVYKSCYISLISIFTCIPYISLWSAPAYKSCYIGLIFTFICTLMYQFDHCQHMNLAILVWSLPLYATCQNQFVLFLCMSHDLYLYIRLWFIILFPTYI